MHNVMLSVWLALQKCGRCLDTHEAMQRLEAKLALHMSRIEMESQVSASCPREHAQAHLCARHARDGPPLLAEMPLLRTH